MPKLQGVGHGEATAELRGGLMRLMGSIPAWIALHCALAVMGTALARRYALSRQLLDKPDKRRSHAVATPRGGGIAIVVCLGVALSWLAWRFPQQRELLAAIGIGLGLVAGVGWRDDHRPLSAWVRLATHVLAGAIFAFALYRHGASPLSTAMGFTVVVASINLWNFMDGIDALATSQTILVALAIVLLAHPPLVLPLALSLLGACLGFLPFNLPRAKIFLGDVGSGALGCMVAMLLALTAGADLLRWLLLSLPCSAFFVDAGLTLGSRIVAGERWWTAHVQHLYQRMARRGGHAKVTAAYMVWTVLGIALMCWLRTQPPARIMCGAIGWHLLGAGVWYVLTSKDHPAMQGTSR